VVEGGRGGGWNDDMDLRGGPGGGASKAGVARLGGRGRPEGGASNLVEVARLEGRGGP